MFCDPILSTIYCVLDSLNKCNGALLEVLLKKFRALFLMNSSESLSSYLNLIIVSCNLLDFILEVLSSFPCMQLDTNVNTKVNNNIHQFIKVKVNKLSIYREYLKLLCIHIKEVF